MPRNSFNYQDMAAIGSARKIDKTSTRDRNPPIHGFSGRPRRCLRDGLHHVGLAEVPGQVLLLQQDRGPVRDGGDPGIADLDGLGLCGVAREDRNGGSEAGQQGSASGAWVLLLAILGDLVVPPLLLVRLQGGRRLGKRPIGARARSPFSPLTSSLRASSLSPSARTRALHCCRRCPRAPPRRRDVSMNSPASSINSNG